MADKKKTTKKKTDKKSDTKKKEPSASETNLNLMKSEALKKIVEHNRDYLKLDLTLPLGDKALKQVHTNQWLFTDLPKEFDLANWTILAKALNANTNRWEGYVENRWYIESVDISCDVSSAKYEMKLGLNAFASSYNTYSDAYKGFEKAYTQATTKTTTTEDTKKTSGSKNTTNAVTNKTSSLNKEWIKKYNISSTITKKVEEILKPNWGDYTKVRKLFQWCDDHLPYEGYGNTRYGAAGTLKHGAGNCCDHAHLFAAMCRSIGVKCNYIHNPCCGEHGHVYNKVYIGDKSDIVDTGRDNASWGSHWGNAGCPTEKTSINF